MPDCVELVVPVFDARDPPRRHDPFDTAAKVPATMPLAAESKRRRARTERIGLVLEARIRVAASDVRHPVPCRPAEPPADAQYVVKVGCAVQSTARAKRGPVLLPERREDVAFNTEHNLAELMLDADVPTDQARVLVNARRGTAEHVFGVDRRPLPARTEAEVEAAPVGRTLVGDLPRGRVAVGQHRAGATNCRGDRDHGPGGKFAELVHTDVPQLEP